MQPRGTTPDRQPTTVIVERTVATGHEDDFRDLAESITDAARRHPGFLGWGLLRTAPDSGDWNIVYRFDTTDHLDAWEASPDRIRLLASGADFMRTVSERRIQETARRGDHDLDRHAATIDVARRVALQHPHLNARPRRIDRSRRCGEAGPSGRPCTAARTTRLSSRRGSCRTAAARRATTRSGQVRRHRWPGRRP